MRRWLSRLSRLWLMLMAGSLCLSVWPLSQSVAADQLLQRSVELSSATPGATASQKFSFTFQSVASMGSLSFLYCSNSPRFSDPCTTPAGLDLTNAQLSNQTGNTGFNILSINSSRIVLSRPSASTSTITSSYTLANIANPPGGNLTVFVRLASYSSADGSGPATDNGSVAFSTNSILTVGAYVPPYLTFCAGKTVASDCSSSATSLVDLGTLKTNSVSSGQSQMAAATNDNNGYFVSMFGTTLTSGNNVIAPLSSPTASLPGTGQFGINLRANTNPSIGQEPSGDGTAAPTTNYAQQNLFTFNDGDTIIGAPNSTAFNRMTVAYLANINSAQAPGIYTTTLTFIATVQF